VFYDVFCSRILIHYVNGFTEVIQHFYDRVFFGQDHPMIHIGVDPSFDHVFDVSKINHHSARVQGFSGNVDLKQAVVTMQVFTLAVILE